MKIFIVTPFFPYAKVPHAGGRFIYDLVHCLSQKHMVYLLSRIAPDELQFADEMKYLCHDVNLYQFRNPVKRNLFGLLQIALSYVILGLKANRMIRGGRFDVVQVEFVETGLLIRAPRGVAMVLDAHDVLGNPWKRRYLSTRGIGKFTQFLFWKMLETVERYIYKKFDIIFTRSDHDRDFVMNLGIRGAVEVIPHPAGAGLNFNDYDVKKEPYSLLFLGAMDRDANILAALHFYNSILPHIRRVIPQVKFYIVGNSPPEEIKQLGVRDSNVFVTGYVDRVEPYYLKATAFVSPILIGGGIIAKNLDAMSAGCPVVTTSLGNEGIGAMPDKEILVADDPVDFAQKVVTLFSDPDLRAEIGRNGQEFVMRHFSLDSIMNKIESHYSRLLATNVE